MIRTVGSCSRAARQTEASRSIDSEGSREPIKPILTYRTPQLAAPVAARAAIPGRLGASPIAALTGTPGGVSWSTCLITCGKFAPKDPSRGFFTSMISAPPATAGPTSSWCTTLTNSCILTATPAPLTSGPYILQGHTMVAEEKLDDAGILQDGYKIRG